MEIDGNIAWFDRKDKNFINVLAQIIYSVMTHRGGKTTGKLLAIIFLYFYDFDDSIM